MSADDSRQAEWIAQVERWLDESRSSGGQEATAMALATTGADGKPSVRYVLLKGFERGGFVFYTNQQSRKGQQLQANPHAALTMLWEPLHRQLLAEGTIEPVSASEADAYWATRPRDSKIGAWASLQSQPLASRADLEARFERVRAEHNGRDVPRPAHWSGYRLVPQRVEFWQQRSHRLHHRTLYYVDGMAWHRTLLNP